MQSYDDNSAYVLGGVADQSGVWVPGMVEFDMTLRNFTNHRTSSTTSSDLSGINKVSLQYVPWFGSQSIYVATDGWTRSSSNFLGTVHVYDAAAQEWFKQKTTGIAPSSRVELCTAGVISTNGTFEIFMYAGWDGNNYGIQDDTIHILSLPGFHWIQVQYTPKSGRFAHTRHSVGGSQILTVGGIDANPKITTNANFTALIKSNFNTTADPFAQGLGVFDMSSLTWASQYTANEPDYEWSAPIKRFYQDSNKAYVQNLDQNVLTLVDMTHFAPFPNETNATTTSSTTTSAAQSGANGGKSNKGAIAGGVVGGLVALALITALIFYLLRWRSERMKHLRNRSMRARMGVSNRNYLMTNVSSQSWMGHRRGRWLSGIRG